MKEFIENTSIHGINHITKDKTHRISKLFWMLAVIASICGFGYYIRLAFIKLFLV